MTRVAAPSRLHFGLLNAGGVPGLPRFGGCGLMIESPGVVVRVEPASEWNGEGPSADRAVEFARRVTADPHRVVVEQCPPEHVGLGVGTALGLAVAKALRPELTAVELAPLVGRGQRSGVGLYGFDRGGFIVDAGRTGDALPRLSESIPFPAPWRIVLIVPDQPSHWHGSDEQAAFARDRDPVEAARTAGRMQDWLEGEIAPGLKAADFVRFSAGVYEYNRLAGEAFTLDQCGTYTGRMVTTIIGAVREAGCTGVGQSSWGPAVFAFAPDAARARSLSDAIRGQFADLPMVEVVSAAVRGARVESH
jgi:beta-RFAP synthase